METEKLSVNDKLGSIHFQLFGLSCICNDIFKSLESNDYECKSADSICYVACTLDKLSVELDKCLIELYNENNEKA